MQILREVVARCQEAHIAVLPVKGVVTSHLLYDDVAERPLADVDVRVRRRDLPGFRRMARDAGWTCLRVTLSYHNVVYAFPPLSLDVEVQIGPPGLCALSVDDMLSRAATIELAPSLHVLVPEIHDHAVLLTVNAFKDKIATASAHALADLERVVEHPSFVQDVFLERVIGARVWTLTWLVARWMDEHRGARGWRAIRQALERRDGLRWAYASLFERLLDRGQAAQLPMRLLARCAADGRGMQARALLAAFARDTERFLRRHLTRPGASAAEHDPRTSGRDDDRRG